MGIDVGGLHVHQDEVLALQLSQGRAGLGLHVGVGPARATDLLDHLKPAHAANAPDERNSSNPGGGHAVLLLERLDVREHPGAARQKSVGRRHPLGDAAFVHRMVPQHFV